MHQIRFPLEFRSPLGSLLGSAVFKGHTFKEREGEGEEKGEERKGRKGPEGMGRTTLRTPVTNSLLRHCTNMNMMY